MDNKDVLAAAQKNKHRGKEYEDHVFTNGDTLAIVACILVGSLLFLVEYFLTNTLNIGLIAVGTCACGVELFHEGLKLKKCHYIVIGIFMLLVCVMAIISFIGKMVLA